MKAALAFVALLLTPALAEPPFTVAPKLFDASRPNDLGLKPAPGAQTFTVFQAGEGTDHYVNGVALIGFKGKLYAQWQSSAKDEDAPDTHVVYASSADGVHWSKPTRLAAADGTVRTSGGWWTSGPQLVAFLNVWPKGFDPVAGGRTEVLDSLDARHWSPAYALRDADGHAIAGIIEQDTRALPGGRLITAIHLAPGLVVAPFYTDDPFGVGHWTRGKMTNLPHTGAESRELEPSWFRRADGCLVMVFRDQDNTFRQLASESCDRGVTWTTPVVTGMPDARQKQSAGNLSDGTAFMVHAPSGNKLRSPLVLSLSKDGRVFDRAYLLRAGPPPEPRYPGLYKRAGYHYPKSVVWNGALWIGYADAKESVAVVRVPLTALH
jgi:hypothetical protein